MRPGLGNALRFPCPRSEETENIVQQMCLISRGWQLHHLVNPNSIGYEGSHALDLSARSKVPPCWLAVTMMGSKG